MSERARAWSGMRRASSLLFFLCLPLLLLLYGCGGTTVRTYGLNASATSLVLTQGTSGTVTISLTTANQYAGTVSISAQGLPSGVTVTPATASLTAGSSTMLTVSAASTATVGTTQVVVSGSSPDGQSATATIALTVNAPVNPPVAPKITLSASPATLTLAAGGFAQITLTGTATSSVSSDIAVTITGLPAGVTASPSSLSVSPGTPATVTLIADASAAGTTAPATVTFAGTDDSQNASATVALNVTAAPPVVNNQDFSLEVTPFTLTLAPGSSAQVAVNSTAIAGFFAPITVSVTGLPTGVTVSPSTLTLAPGVPQTMTLTADANAPATSEAIAVTFSGVSGSLKHTATIQVTVASAADFSLSVTPASLSVAQGAQSSAVQISTTSLHGLTGNVTVTASGLPAGVTATPNTSSPQLGNPESMVFTASSSAAIGTANVTITATSRAIVHTAVVALTVTAPPPPTNVTVTLSSSSVTVPQNGFGLITVTATGPDTVKITLKGLPAGVTATPATASLMSGMSQNFVLTASGVANVGTASVTVIGQDFSLFGTANLSVQVIAPPSYPDDVPTWHYDAQRTGLRSDETVLTPTAVNSKGFGRLNSWAADGAVDAQPLYAANLTIATQPHNVLYIATENDSVYALDASTGTVLWQSSALGANETASDDRGCSEITPNIGITATPVIDRNYPPNGAIFFVALSKDGSGTYHQRLHARDLTNGAELQGSPVEITATYPGTGVTSDGTNNTFDSSKYVERAALLLSNSTLYLSWTNVCQQTTPTYSSWVMAYSEPTLQQQSVLNLTPNGSGGGISMSGAGPAADLSGNVYLAVGPGTFDTTLTADAYTRPINGDYGNAYMKLENGSTGLSAFDYFEPLEGIPGSAHYADQGTGGMVVIPDIPNGTSKGIPIYMSLVAGAGRDGNIYEMDRSGQYLGEYDGMSDNAYNIITNALPSGATSTPAYYNGLLYYGGVGDVVKSFDVPDLLTTPSDMSTVTLGTSGATPVITANGTSGAVIWLLDTGATGGPVLHALDATNLGTEFYNSTQAQTNGTARDSVHTTDKYAVPVVANGHLYIGTKTGVDVFGLLP